MRRSWAAVTGGAQGIGRAVVEALLDAGWSVLAMDSDAEAVAELSPEVVGVVGDVAAADAGARLKAALATRTDRLELIVHNAGIGYHAPPAAPDLQAFQRVLAVNLVAPYALTCALLPLLQRAGSAAVIHVASTRALMSEPDTEAYAASKGGLVALTHALAVSLGPMGIRVNAVSPGWIATDAWRKRSERRQPELRPVDHAQHPAGRVGRPEDVARAVLFLADPHNDFITGANLIVDGGMVRKMIYEP